MEEKIMADRFDHAAANLGRIGAVLHSLPLSIKAGAHEIRIRCGKPVVVTLSSGNVMVTESGQPAYNLRCGLLTARKEDLEESFRFLCDSSVHSHQQEIKNGFITISGGHRAGICGTAVTADGVISNIRDISSINLRVAREIRGAADETASVLFSGGSFRGALIAGPPGCGKTTVLRDLARQLSIGIYGDCRVTVVDERGELAATYRGVSQNDLGLCDILDGYPKGEGILQAVRSLSPDVIICDEIGNAEDAQAVSMSLNAGVAVIASAHAGSLRELCSRPQFKPLLKCGAFGKAVFLRGRSQPGKISSVYEEEEWNGTKSDGTDRRFLRLQRGRPAADGKACKTCQTA